MQIKGERILLRFSRLNLQETSAERRDLRLFSREIVSRATSFGKAALNFPTRRTRDIVSREDRRVV